MLRSPPGAVSGLSGRQFLDEDEQRQGHHHGAERDDAASRVEPADEALPALRGGGSALPLGQQDGPGGRGGRGKRWGRGGEDEQQKGEPQRGERGQPRATPWGPGSAELQEVAHGVSLCWSPTASGAAPEAVG